MAVVVRVPLRIVIDPQALASRLDDLGEATTAATTRALANAAAVISETRGAGLAHRTSEPVVAWTGEALGDVSPETRERCEAVVREALAQAVTDALPGGGPGGGPGGTDTADAGRFLQLVGDPPPDTAPPADSGGGGGGGDGGGGGGVVPVDDPAGHPPPPPADTPTPAVRRPARRRVERPWIVLRDIYFRTFVGEFINWLEFVRGMPLPERALYTDLEYDLRWVSVWWVRTNRTVILSDLAELLVRRATELSRLRSAQTLAHAVSPFDYHRLELASLDTTGRVLALPSLDERNARRVEGTGQDLTVLHGGWVVFAFMTLPVITAADLLVLMPGTGVDVRLRDLAFMLDAAEFESAFGLPWERFAEEFGDDPVRVELQPAEVRQEAAVPAIGYLLSREVEPRVRVSGVPVQRLFLLSETAIGRMPEAVRLLADGWTDDVTRLLDEDSLGDRLMPGMRVLYALADLSVDRERIAAAAMGPRARDLAELIRQSLRAERTREWPWQMLGFLGDHFGRYYPDVRPPGGTLFEHVLVELERTGDFTRLYDAIDDTGHFGLRHRLLQNSLPTNFASHPRVVRLHEELSAAVLASSANVFRADTDPPEIWLDRDSDDRVRVGDVLGDLHSIYLVTRDLQRLKAEPARRLREALETQRVELLRRVGSGTDSAEYSDEEFATQVLAAAAQLAGITEDDFEEITIERSIKLVGLVRRDVDGLPSFDVSFRFVERVEDSGGEWIPVSAVLTENHGDFGARLIYWRLGRMGEVYMVMGVAVTIVGVVAIAWEIGLVAALVELAGGTAVVLTSIAISEVIYILRVIFGDAELSVGGFLMAAVDGYLMALGFRAGSVLGLSIARRIGTASLQRLVVGWVAQRLVTGVVGGGLSAGLELFAHDVVAVATGTGSWSSIGDYVSHMAIGAIFGVVAEFTLAPVLSALLTRGGSAIAGIAELVTRVRSEGLSSIQLSATVTEGLSNMRRALTELTTDMTSQGFVTAFRTRIGEVLTEMGAGVVSRRVLELAGARFTRQATEGLQRFLAAAEAGTPSRALAVTNVFARHPQETVHFLEVLARLDDATARRLIDGTFGRRADLAAFLGRLARYEPEAQRGVIRMLAELDIRVGEPVPGITAEQVLERQLAASLRVRAAGIELDIAGLRREIARLEGEANLADSYNPARAGRLRTRAAEVQSEIDNLQAQIDDLLASAGPPRSVVPTDPELEQAFADLEAGVSGGAVVGVRIPLGELLDEPELLERLVRPIFRSRSGNRVVFRVEGGSHPDLRSQELIHIDANGNVRLSTGGALNLNFGVYERAVQFLIEHRPGGVIKVFEVEEAWFRMLRGAASPEGGTADLRGVPRLVDVRFGEDQLQVLDDEAGSLIRELQEFIVPGSGRVVRFQ